VLVKILASRPLILSGISKKIVDMKANHEALLMVPAGPSLLLTCQDAERIQQGMVVLCLNLQILDRARVSRRVVQDSLGARRRSGSD
jgi:hypothetical protein